MELTLVYLAYLFILFRNNPEALENKGGRLILSHGMGNTDSHMIIKELTGSLHHRIDRYLSISVFFLDFILFPNQQTQKSWNDLIHKAQTHEVVLIQNIQIHTKINLLRWVTYYMHQILNFQNGI